MHPSRIRTKKKNGGGINWQGISDLSHVIHVLYCTVDSANNVDEAEDGGFGVCGDKTRYATLQRQRQQQNPDGTLRNFRNNISSLSQEVTYAELTLPRNKGYTPLLRTTPTPTSTSVPHQTVISPAGGCEPVIYARIEHNCGLMMNTSVDSSSSSASVKNAGDLDEGFASGSSPVAMLPPSTISVPSSSSGSTSGSSSSSVGCCTKNLNDSASVSVASLSPEANRKLKSALTRESAV